MTLCFWVNWATPLCAALEDWLSCFGQADCGCYSLQLLHTCKSCTCYDSILCITKRNVHTCTGHLFFFRFLYHTQMLGCRALLLKLCYQYSAIIKSVMRERDIFHCNRFSFLKDDVLLFPADSLTL